MNKLTLQVFIGMVLMLMSYVVNSQVGISPRLLILDDSKLNSAQAFRLFNFTDKELAFEVVVKNWTMDEDSQTQLIESEPDALDRWLLVNPLTFTLSPQSSQTVRLAFRPPSGIKDGEYRSMLYFNQVIRDDQPEVKQLKSRIKIGAAVYMHLGEKNIKAEITQTGLNQSGPHITIANQGNGHVRFKGQWSLWKKEPLETMKILEERPESLNSEGLLAHGDVPTTPVLPGHTRTIQIGKTNLTSESHVPLFLLLNGEFGGEKFTKVFSVIPSDHGQ